MSLLTGACGDSKSNISESDSASDSSSGATMDPMTEPTTSGSMSASGTGSTTAGSMSASGTGSTTEVMSTSGTGSTTDVTATGGTTIEATSGGSTTFDPNDCGESAGNTPIVTPSVMLVLDKSGSMVADPNGFWDHDSDDADSDGFQDVEPAVMATPRITRWQSLWEVTDLITSGFNGSMNMGMVLFPSKTATGEYSEVACVVSATPEVPIAPMNAANILAAIPSATADNTLIQGGTPATKGIKTAISELEGAPADQPKFMILVTDGAANCQENAPDTVTLFEMYDEALAPTIAAAAATGIQTYVVGIDISQKVSPVKKDANPDNINTYEKLNEVAIAGGVPRPGEEKFFNAKNQEELQAALEMISMQILSCP